MYYLCVERRVKMKMAVKETLCTKCSHLAVCKYVEDMEIAILQTDKINTKIDATGGVER